MLLTDARRPARTGPGGDLIPLAEQDRRRWDGAASTEGVELVTRAMSRSAPGPYQLQAAIAAVHDEAPSTARTGWPQILALYGLLQRLDDNPIVALNHSVAAAMVHGPGNGLELLKTLDADPRIATSHRLAAVRAHLLEMAGDRAGAAINYQQAARRTTSQPERRSLLRQAAKLTAGAAEDASGHCGRDPSRPGVPALSAAKAFPRERFVRLKAGSWTSSASVSPKHPP
ncbi:MAG: hypothetical protein H0V67_09875 [Geodermatophilaceae bacterium]|nr:hypothetical protein [Geodermatophilaceae bacterium]